MTETVFSNEASPIPRTALSPCCFLWKTTRRTSWNRYIIFTNFCADAQQRKQQEKELKFSHSRTWWRNYLLRLLYQRRSRLLSVIPSALRVSVPFPKHTHVHVHNHTRVRQQTAAGKSAAYIILSHSHTHTYTPGGSSAGLGSSWDGPWALYLSLCFFGVHVWLHVKWPVETHSLLFCFPPFITPLSLSVLSPFPCLSPSSVTLALPSLPSSAPSLLFPALSTPPPPPPPFLVSIHPSVSWQKMSHASSWEAKTLSPSFSKYIFSTLLHRSLSVSFSLVLTHLSALYHHLFLCILLLCSVTPLRSPCLLHLSISLTRFCFSLSVWKSDCRLCSYLSLSPIRCAERRP